MFKAMFEKQTRYMFITVSPECGGYHSQVFASVASVLRWLDSIGVTDTRKAFWA